MTFTILGHCRRTNRTGLAMASVALGVGGLSPTYNNLGDIVVVQAFGNPHAAVAGLKALGEGLSAKAALDRIQSLDRLDDWRQIGVLRRDGEVAAVTGPAASGWAGEIMGDGFVAMGNTLAGEQVVARMALTFEHHTDLPLEERLMRALEAGRDAGGQANASGTRLTERAAALKVHAHDNDGHAPWLDLRVDIHPEAVDELRRSLEIYKPLSELLNRVAHHPEEARKVDLVDWEARHMQGHPPPAPLKAQDDDEED